MSHPKYLSSTWFDPRIVKAPSPIHGQGLFATDLIREGEVIIVFGGLVLTQEELDAGKLPPGKWSEDMIDDGLFMFAPEEGMDYFLNHSCDPNLWLTDEVTAVARRDIQPGEELGLDYALIQTGENYSLGPCRCGSPLCRMTITGGDWLLPRLQERYRDHFMPYISRRIARLHSES